jgi:DNA-binding NarL/FixJ family response regulator
MRAHTLLGASLSIRLMRQATVLIAEDHPSVVDGLLTLLRDRFDVVGVVGDGRLLVDAATRLRPDIIVTDISMPGLNGLEAFDLLKAGGSEAKVIVLTLHADAELAATVIRAGASGFVVKLAAAIELIPAIEQVLNGNVYVSPGL